MSVGTEGLARSVHTRLIQHAKRTGLDPTLVLTRYGIERFLYRLSASAHAERFVLKGALLLAAVNTRMKDFFDVYVLSETFRLRPAPSGESGASHV